MRDERPDEIDRAAARGMRRLRIAPVHAAPAGARNIDRVVRARVRGFAGRLRRLRGRHVPGSRRSGSLRVAARVRRHALADFYGGPVWKAHRDAANATMIDSDDVLLLRPAWAGSGFDLDPCLRPAHGRHEAAQSLVIARIYPFDAPVRADFIDWFRRRAMPLFETLGAQTVAALATEEATNDFTALPVREGEHVFAWFAHFGGHAAYARFFEAVTHARRWNDELLPELQRRVGGKPPLLRLAPTARSLLR